MSGRRAARILLGIAGLAVAAVVAVAWANTPPDPAPGPPMTVSSARAVPFAGRENPVLVEAVIENPTGRDDWLTGASSPVARRAEMDATVDRGSPGPTDDGSGMVGLSPLPRMLVPAGESLTLRGGDGQVTLVGVAPALSPGQVIAVTFTFEHAAPVTVSVPVVAGG